MTFYPRSGGGRLSNSTLSTDQAQLTFWSLSDPVLKLQQNTIAHLVYSVLRN